MITTEAVGELVLVVSKNSCGESFALLIPIQEAYSLSCELSNAARKAQKHREQILYGSKK